MTDDPARPDPPAGWQPDPSSAPPPPPPPGAPYPPQAYPPPTGYGQPGYGQPLAPYDPNAPVAPSQPNDTLWAVLCHLSYFVFALLFPLIIMLTVGKESPFVKRQSTEALNFHLSLLIYSLVSAILILILIGIAMVIAVVVFGVVFAIIAAVKASQGEDYRYPLTIRMVK